MNKEVAAKAIEFLQRCPLKGSEVPQFAWVMAELSRIVQEKQED